MPESMLRNDGKQHQSQPVCRLNSQEQRREEMQREVVPSLLSSGNPVKHCTDECSEKG